MRITIRVRPGAARTSVGGEHNGALVVRVTKPAVDGKATAAALDALAEALDIPRSDVQLVSGATSRTKIVDIPAGSTAAIAELCRGRAGRQASG